MSELDPSTAVGVVAASSGAAPMTRKERRALEQARALAASAQSSVRLEDGSAPVLRTRKDMRMNANNVARSLTVTRAEDAPISAPTEVPSSAIGASAPAPAASPIMKSPVEQVDVYLPFAVSDDPALREVAKASLASSGQIIRPKAETPEQQAKRLLAQEQLIQEPFAVVPTEAEAVAVSTNEIDISTFIEDATVNLQDSPLAASNLEDTGSVKPVPSSPEGVYHQVEDVVASVIGDDAATEPEVSASRTRRPLDRPSATHRPLRARKAVSLRSAEANLTPRRKIKAPRAVIQRLMAGGAIVFIGGLVAVTSLPAEAFTGFASPTESAAVQPAALSQAEISQRVEVDASAHGAEEASFYLGNDELTVNDALATARLSPDELAALQAVADGEAVGNYYSGSPAMPNVWSMLETDFTQSPFPSLAEVPISSGFGYRWGSFHGGVDMTPGAGTPIFPVANGVVTAVFQGNHPGGGGYMVIVEHNIDGEYYQSWYPHMEAGSIQVEVGQVIDITTQIGGVGSTGNSTGAHLHLEVKNSSYVSFDPVVWLQTREEVLEPGFGG